MSSGGWSAGASIKSPYGQRYPETIFFVIKGRGNNLFRQPAVNGGTESGL